MKKRICLLFLFASVSALAQDLQVYSMYISGNEVKNGSGFISFSDNYPYNTDTILIEDSLVMPDVSEIRSYNEAKYIKLGKPFRQRFLTALKIAESDRIFLYDYAKDVLVTVPVSQANVVAWLNEYISDDERFFSRQDYRIGFEITKSQLKSMGLHTTALACVGKENPFVQGKMKRMVWQKIPASEFPKIAMEPPLEDQAAYRYAEKGRLGDAHKYEVNGYVFYTQDYLYDKDWQQARRLLVLEAKTQKTVVDEFYSNSEGEMVPPLGLDKSEQYTGQLFKGRPPVYFGFMWYSFSCEALCFLDSKEYIYIKCDARH